MGKIVGGIKYKLQKEMLKMSKCEWVHKKNERMLKKKQKKKQEGERNGGRGAPDRLKQASAGKAVFAEREERTCQE